MSRIGKKLITLPAGVTVQVENSVVKATGPKGVQEVRISPGVSLTQTGSEIQVQVAPGKNDNATIGLNRSLVQNAVTGVTTGWSKSLELIGVGYRAQTDGKELILNVGFSHQVKIPAPQGITFSVAENKITVSGSDKYVIGETAAKIRRVRKPEPYKGKGIRYVGEHVRKKAGKAGKAAGGAAGAK